MKKYLFMLLAAVAMICTSAVMTSCGSDDDDTIDNSSIVGTWSNIDSGYIFVTYTRTLTFLSDGTFTYTLSTVYRDERGSSQEDLGSGTYSYNVTKNILTLNMKKSSSEAAGTMNATVTSYPSKTFYYKGYTFTKR